MTRKQLGRIQKVSYGFGGYDEAMFGVSFTLGGEGWGVGDFWGEWPERSERAEYSEEEHVEICMKNRTRLHKLIRAAKVITVDDLHGVPVEVEFEGNTLKSWRVLTEVLR